MRDIECGQRMGLKTVWVTREITTECQPNIIARNLLEAVGKILDKS
jgi:hypothetical protein